MHIVAGCASDPHSAQHWVSTLFLRCWVPELSDVPPESPHEEAFLEWLGVEQRLSQPELVVQRLKLNSAFAHRFLEELPEHPEAVDFCGFQRDGGFRKQAAPSWGSP